MSAVVDPEAFPGAPLTIDLVIARVEAKPAALLDDELITFAAGLNDLDLARLKQRLALIKKLKIGDFVKLVRARRKVDAESDAASKRPPRDASAAAFERGDHVELAMALVKRLKTEAPILADLGNLHAYQAARGVWIEIETSRSSNVVQSFAGARVATSTTPLALCAGDVRGAITLAKDRVARQGFFANGPPGLAFANGFVRVVDGVLRTEAHSPAHAARFSYDFAFTSNQSAARWIGCLNDAFAGDVDAADKIACLQEFGGAALLGMATAYQRALVLTGIGANAKSTIARVIGAAFPIGSTCAIPPQTWGNEYRLAMMAGKLLNAVNELPEAEILDGAEFKSVISGDATTGRAIREAPFTFQPKAGHLFATNRLPGSNDLSHGFWRRLIVITFNRVFAEHEQNAKLPDEILANELPGVVAWLLAGALRVLQSGRYTVPASSLDAVKGWRRGADPVALFVEERTRTARTDAQRTPAGRLFATYVAWAELNRFRVMSSKSFGDRMRGLGLGSVHTNTGAMYGVSLDLRTEEDADAR